jgi:hypothetical protein
VTVGWLSWLLHGLRREPWPTLGFFVVGAFLGRLLAPAILGPNAAHVRAVQYAGDFPPQLSSGSTTTVIDTAPTAPYLGIVAPSIRLVSDFDSVLVLLSANYHRERLMVDSTKPIRIDLSLPTSPLIP